MNHLISDFATCSFPALTAMNILANHSTDVIFPSAAASFEQSFIQDGKNVITLPSNLFTAQGSRACFFCLFIFCLFVVVVVFNVYN